MGNSTNYQNYGFRIVNKGIIDLAATQWIDLIWPRLKVLESNRYWSFRMPGYGYRQTLSGVARHVRLAPNSRHQNWDVGNSADFVCFAPGFGRLEDGTEWSVRDPQATFIDLRV